MRAPTSLTRLLLPTLLAVPGLAQSGPWTDGEIVVRSKDPATGKQALYRIAPESGQGELLVLGFNWTGGYGSLAFDSHRGRLLANMAQAPDPLQTPELWLIDHDGTGAKVPALSGVRMNAIAPVGDGRVYYQPFDPAAHPIHYLDADDQDRVLMDETGAAPFDLDVENMVYDPYTNSLFASASLNWTFNDCVPLQSSLYRIPLSADGSRVGGPLECTGLSYTTPVVGLDRFCGGDILVQMEGQFPDHGTIRRVDPVSLSVSLWAKTFQTDIDGGFFCARIGKTIVLDGWNDELLAYGPGSGSQGTPIPSNVPVSTSETGSGPGGSAILEIDLNGPGCGGVTYSYGTGVAGTGGHVPSIYANGCPNIGGQYSLTIDGALGGAPGIVLVGQTSTDQPFLGGSLYVIPDAAFAVVASGAPGVAGDGGVFVVHHPASPVLVGLEYFWQAGFVDPAAIDGVSLTGALQIVFG